MAKSARERYETERSRIEHLSGIRPDPDRDEPTDEISEADGEAVLDFLDAKDPESVTTTDPTGDSGKADSTLSNYAFGLRRVAVIAEFDLLDADADGVNEIFSDMVSGDAPGVKDDGLTRGTVKTYQSPARKFFEYQDGVGIEKEEIAMFTDNGSSVDERDIFDSDDVDAIRSAASHPRDKALVDLLLYTGQRLDAVLSLQVRDIELSDGVFYLNQEGDLKGASGKRSLMYAEKAVRDWMNSHPHADDPDAHFITHKYGWEGKDYEPGEKLDSSSVYRQLQRIGDAADVDKPCNPHNFRHTFVTVAKRDYGMDNDIIKQYIGQSQDSTIMESTYSHLSDDDVNAAAERAAGLRDDEPDESTFTPEVCDVCGSPVTSPSAKACPDCGTAFTPDAKQAEREIQQDVGASKALADTDDLTEQDLEELADDDAILSKLIEIRSENKAAD